MASAAEQLAANLNFGAFAKADELKKRIWFTLGALIVFRLGTYIPLPGIDPAAFEASFTGHRQGVLDMFNMFSGGGAQDAQPIYPLPHRRIGDLPGLRHLDRPRRSAWHRHRTRLPVPRLDDSD